MTSQQPPPSSYQQLPNPAAVASCPGVKLPIPAAAASSVNFKLPSPSAGASCASIKLPPMPPCRPDLAQNQLPQHGAPPGPRPKKHTYLPGRPSGQGRELSNRGGGVPAAVLRVRVQGYIDLSKSYGVGRTAPRGPLVEALPWLSVGRAAAGDKAFAPRSPQRGEPPRLNDRTLSPVWLLEEPAAGSASLSQPASRRPRAVSGLRDRHAPASEKYVQQAAVPAARAAVQHPLSEHTAGRGAAAVAAESQDPSGSHPWMRQPSSASALPSDPAQAMAAHAVVAAYCWQPSSSDKPGTPVLLPCPISFAPPRTPVLLPGPIARPSPLLGWGPQLPAARSLSSRAMQNFLRLGTANTVASNGDGIDDGSGGGGGNSGGGGESNGIGDGNSGEWAAYRKLRTGPAMDDASAGHSSNLLRQGPRPLAEDISRGTDSICYRQHSLPGLAFTTAAAAAAAAATKDPLMWTLSFASVELQHHLPRLSRPTGWKPPEGSGSKSISRSDPSHPGPRPAFPDLTCPLAPSPSEHSPADQQTEDSRPSVAADAASLRGLSPAELDIAFHSMSSVISGSSSRSSSGSGGILPHSQPCSMNSSSKCRVAAAAADKLRLAEEWTALKMWPLQGMKQLQQQQPQPPPLQQKQKATVDVTGAAAAAADGQLATIAPVASGSVSRGKRRAFPARLGASTGLQRAASRLQGTPDPVEQEPSLQAPPRQKAHTRAGAVRAAAEAEGAATGATAAAEVKAAATGTAPGAATAARLGAGTAATGRATGHVGEGAACLVPVTSARLGIAAPRSRKLLSPALIGGGPEATAQASAQDRAQDQDSYQVHTPAWAPASGLRTASLQSLPENFTGNFTDNFVDNIPPDHFSNSLSDSFTDSPVDGFIEPAAACQPRGLTSTHQERRLAHSTLPQQQEQPLQLRHSAPSSYITSHITYVGLRGECVAGSSLLADATARDCSQQATLRSIRHLGTSRLPHDLGSASGLSRRQECQMRPTGGCHGEGGLPEVASHSPVTSYQLG